MNDNIKEIESKMNSIIQKNEDAIKGYEKAAENAKSVGLQSYFNSKILERRNFLVNLKSAAPALDLREGIEGSVTGAIHRTWMDVKTAFSSNDDEAVLEEAIRGDKAAIEEYNEVLADVHLPVEAASIIRQQRDWLMDDLKQIKSMEDVA
ncbi:PA2169 family four-helix-bundle protein [Cellulophaga sp. HaHaR_3_176]|uniref:ferritin-like domain-containing protein n=1 Tax=Cellulophaga sp. HaHaR_3_176 TaxID=1942464 RepID=UPI001C1FB76E|nr:PA2169 family four-helix-bundle protein [Cellulophaga sp. HaHaR_3_176]QWX85024.1 PA2169 family four-helix-bundle protein [Cellulophaga sp. HaHaR_3_176]